MSDLLSHVFFFLAMSFAIVVLGAFYGEPEDGPALRSIPRRYLVFVLSCGGVAGIMLVCEYLFAWVR